MNEEYLRGAHKHIGVTDDYETWINAVKDNKDYLVKLHNKLGVTDDFNTWSNSVMGTSKEAPAQADATVVGENTVSSSESILSESQYSTPSNVLGLNIEGPNSSKSFFNKTEEQGVKELRELYPNFIFEEKLFGEGGGLDAITVYTKNADGSKGDKSTSFDMNIGGMNTYGGAAKSEQQGRDNAFDILNNFITENSTQENQNAQTKSKNERKKILTETNTKRDRLAAPEVKDIETKFEDGSLFDFEEVEEYVSSGISTMGMGGGGSTRVVKKQPYKKELKQALEELMREMDGEKPTKEQIQTRAKNIIIDGVQEEKLTEIIESKDYQYNASVKLDVNASTAQKYNLAAKEFDIDFKKDLTRLELKQQDLQDGTEVTRLNEINSTIETEGVNFEFLEGDNLVELKNGKEIPERILNEYIALNQKVNNKINAVNKFAVGIQEKAAGYEDNIAAMDISRRNYNGMEEFIVETALGTGELLMNTSAGMNMLFGGENKSLIKDVTSIKESIQNIRDSYSKDVEFDDAFSSLGNFASFAMQEVSNQIPIFAALAIPGGQAAIGLGAMGDQYINLANERDTEGGRQKSNAEIWWSSVGFGASELVFESLTTLPLIRAAKKGFTTTPGKKTLFDMTSRKYFKENIGKVAYGTLSEPVGEGMTQLTQNFIDGKPLTQGLDHAMFSGLMFGTTLSSMPFARGLYLSKFNDHVKMKEVRKRVGKIKNINNTNKNLQTKIDILLRRGSGVEGISSIDKAKADIKSNNKIITDLQAENLAEMKEVEANLQGTSNDALEQYFALEQGQEEIKNEAQEVVDNNSLNDQQKTDRLKVLQAKFDRTQSAKDFFRDKDAFGDEYTAFSGLDANKDEVAEIEKEARSILNGRGKKDPTRVELFDQAKIIYNTNKINANHAANQRRGLNDVINAQTKEEAIEKINNLSNVDDNVKKEIIKGIQDGNHGVNIPTIDGKNLPMQIVESMAADDRLETRTHEVGHSVFIKAISQDSKAFDGLADQILEHLKTTNPSAYKRVSFRLGNQTASDEVVMLFLEEVASNKVDIKKSEKAGFFATLMNKGIEEVGGTPVDLRGETDAINFLVGIAKKIKDGTIKTKDIADIRANVIAKEARATVPKTKAKAKAKAKASKALNQTDSKGPVDDLGKMGWTDKTWKESGAKFAIETIKDEKLLDALIYAKYKVEDVPANFVDDVITALSSDIKKFNSSYVDKKTGKKVEAKWGTKDENNSLFGYLQGLMRYRADDVYNELYKGDDAIKGAKNIGETTKEGEVKIQIAAEKSSEMEAFEEEDMSIQGQAKKAKAKEQRYSKLRQEMGFKREVLDKDGNVVEEGDKIHKEILDDAIKTLMLEYSKVQSIEDAGLRAKIVANKMKKQYANLNSPFFKQIKNFLTYNVAAEKAPYGTKDVYISQLKKYREAIVESISTADLVQMERNTPDDAKIFITFVKKLTKISEVEDAVKKEKLEPEALNKITKDKKTGKGAFSPSLYDKIMPSPTELVSWADQPGKNPITGLRQGLKGTRKDGIAMRLSNSLVTDATMEAEQSDKFQDAMRVLNLEMLVKNKKVTLQEKNEYLSTSFDLIDLNIKEQKRKRALKEKVEKALRELKTESTLALSAAIGREVNVKFSKSNAIEDISAAMNGSGSVNVYSQIKFSKSHREAYEKQLTKRRPDLTEKQRKNAVQSVFDFVDGKAIPNNKKSKYEKMAMHYTANGFLILPEDGYKVIEAEKIATQKKLDPFSFKNPNELIETYVGEVKGTRTNPDNVKTFSNKTQFAGGVTVYNIEDSKQGQLDTRKVIDTHFGKESNPWCLAARDKRTDQRSGNFKTKAEAKQFADEYKAKGWEVETFYMEQQGEYEVYADLMGDKKTELNDAFEHWNDYNKEGNGHQIAFQNGRLIAFRDGNNMNWWDRNDKPTSGVVVRGKKVDGFKEVIEVNKTKETLLYYEKVTGDKKNGTTIHKDLDGLVILQQTKVDGGFEGEVIKVEKDNRRGNEYYRTQTENYRDGLRVDYKEVRTYIDKKATVKTAFGRDEIRLDNITKYERSFLESEDNIRLPDNEVITIEGTVNQKYFKEFNDPSSVTGWEKTNLPYITPAHERYYGMQGQKVKIVSNSVIAGQTLESIQAGNSTVVTINGEVQATNVKFSKSTIDYNLHASNAKWTTLMDGKRNQVRKSRIAVRDIIDNLPEDSKAARDFFETLHSNIQEGVPFMEIVNTTWKSTEHMHRDNTILSVLSEGALTKNHLANILGQIKKTTEVEVAQIGFNESIKSLDKRLKPLRSNQKKADAIIEWFKHRGKAFKTAKVKHKGQTITTNEQFAQVVIADIAETNGVKGFGFERIDNKGNTRVTFDKKPVLGLKNITEIKQVFSNGTVEQRNEAVKQMKEESGTTIDHLMNVVAGETTVESKKSEVRSMAFDTEGGIRKIAVPARMIINYGKKVELDHRPTVNNVHKKIDQIIDDITPKNKEAKLKELRDYLEGTEVYLITKKADKIINKYKNASGQSYRTNGGKEVYKIQEVEKEMDKHKYMDFKPQFSKSQDFKTINNAIQFSRSAKNPTKGITVLDFDDTLATSKSLIRFTRPNGTKGTLNAEQYASTYENLSELGYKFDFSEFTKVVDGKTAPLFNKAMKLQGKFGPENMFVLTARPMESAGAIHAFLKANGLNIPLKNITGLANSTAEAKALWMAEKVGEGYNDFYFADDALQNVKAVKNMLNQFDVKSKVQQARVKFSKSMDEKFNDILENVTGIGSVKRFSEIKGRKRGDDKGKFRLFIPPSHEDFVGLLYNFMGKGKEGNKHRDFFEQALVRPINRAYREIDTAKQAIANDYKALNEKFPEIKDKLIKTTPDGDFTFSDAIRVYLWNKHGHKIPGLTETDQAQLTELVQSDPQLQAYAETLNRISKQETYVAPGQSWEMGNIRIDLVDATGRVGRAEYFAEFQENAEVIFSEENLNKIEAGYGKDFRSALEDMLHRIKTGVNRPKGESGKPNMFMNWLNASVAGVMFFNTRSALLQQMSNVNYLNFADNNIYTAGKAFANQPQYWKDFAMIFNSDMLKQRRGGLGTDINGAELAEAIKKARPDSMFDQVAIITGKALKLGFLPTQIGDNIAIATGGAAFYRNRVNTYLKEGMSVKEAESKAFTDFQNITQSTQQSARPDMTSQQQASWIGKIVLNFLNTPSQYNRIIKKAALDIKNRRITGPNTSQTQSDMSNMSRILYYGAAQNLIFYSLQTALFAVMFGEDEDEEALLKKKERVIQGSIDTILRGSGIYGVAISTLKNMAIKFMEQRGKGYNKDESAVLMEGLNFSPVLGIKARRIVNAEKTINYNVGVINEMETFDLDNPQWSAVTNYTQSITGAPLNKMYQKVINLRNAADNDYTALQRALFLSGYTTWSLNLGDTDKMEKIKGDLKDKKKKSKKNKSKKKKKQRTYR